MSILSKKKNYTSLFISEEKLQILRLDKKKSKVLGLAEAKLASGIVESGAVKDQEKLAQAIKTLFQSAKFTDRFVVVGIPENKSYTKVLTLPKLKADELTEAVTWEAETYLPISIDQVYLDWKIIGESEKDEIIILLVAVPKDIIDGYTASLQRIGLVPIAFETTALSLVRLIEKQDTRALMVDIRSKHAVLTLSKAQAIQASSIVSRNSQDQAEDRRNLIQTIKKMLNFYEGKQHQAEPVNTIFISGEDLSQDLLTEIANATGREVKPCPMIVQNLPQQESLNFAVVSSLAMKEIASPDDEDTINLLPPTIQDEFDQIQKKKTIKTWSALSLITLLLTTTASIATLFYFQSVHTSLKNEKLSAPLPPAEAGVAIQRTNSFNRQAKTIVDIGSQRKFPQERILNIISKIPEGIQVISINIDEIQHKIRIVGRASKRDVLLKFRDDIETLSEIEVAILPLTSLQKAENIDFVLTADIKKDV